MATIIPQDIITNHILRHLPSKSVGRFRCVSKEWLSLLTDPQFIKTHQKTLNTNHFIFESPSGLRHSVTYNKNHEDVPTITHFSFGFGGGLLIQGSVNGLVLATDRCWILIVINLTTKDYVELPRSLETKFFGLKGFGYDPVSGDYKFVVFCNFAKYYGNVYLYNLRTSTLKLLMSNSPYVDYGVSWECVFVYDLLHRIMSSCGKPVIVAFSFVDEELSELPLPDLYSEIDMTGVDTKLFALGEKLAIFDGVKGDIWLMNEYGVQESWTKIVLNGFNDLLIYKPIVFYNCGKVVFLTDDRLWTYDAEERVFCKSVDNSDLKIKYLLGAYAESLVSPKLSGSN